MADRDGDGRPEAPTPSNSCLFFKNILLASFSILAFVAFYDRFDRTKQTFLRLHTQIVGTFPRVEPSPCGLPAPSQVELGFAIGRRTRTPWDTEPTEAETYDQIVASVCGTTNIYEMIKQFSKNFSIVTTQDTGFSTWNAAENSVINHLCGGEVDTRSEIYGDVRMRIARAYMHSNAAFVRVATGCWTSSQSYPFDALSCDATTAAMVKSEIESAAVDTLVAGQASAATFPETGHMLFRLLILSAIAHADRTLNNENCFGNKLGVNASQFCAQTYAERIGAAPLFYATVSPPPAAAIVLDPTAEPYEVVMQRHGQTCQSGNAFLFDPPSPPPAPAWIYQAVDDTANSDPAILACTHALTFGLLDQRRLFGVPDPRDFFAVDTNWAPALSSLLYNAVGLGRLDEVRVDRKHDQATQLLQYAAYRLGATTQLFTLTGIAIGYFCGWALVPLFVFVVSRFFGIENVTTGLIEPIVRPPPGFAFWFACLVGISATSWALFVEPPRHMSTHYVDSDCSQWSSLKHSNPWKTTDAESSSTDIFIGFIPGVMTVYAAFYMWRIRGGKCSREILRHIPKMFRIVNPRPSEETLIILPQLVVILFLVLGASDSGGSWFDEAITFKLSKPISTEKAQLVADDCLVLAVSAFFIGFTIGGLCTRWVVTQQELVTFKVPYMAIVMGSAFFPLLFQANLVLTNSETGTDRYTYFVGSIIAQGISGVLLLRSFTVFSVTPATAKGDSVEVLKPGQEYKVAKKNYHDVPDQGYWNPRSSESESARVGGSKGLSSGQKLTFGGQSRTGRGTVEQLPLLQLKVIGK